MARIIVGIILGILLMPFAALVWMNYGKVPVAVADKPLPYERQITGMLLNARIDKEVVQVVPVVADETNLVAGARIYSEKCAFCHGFHGNPSPEGDNMFPHAPQLWEAHRNGSVVGVSDDPPGETYWKVANGIRLTGMPAYKTQLSDTEMWQVSLVLAHADKPLPPGALAYLRVAPAKAAAPAPGRADQK
jgi:thiosulfate dehydrogenase